ncbi:Protein N-acetyltransferase, RimJ/RimL family [Bacillus sp. OV166]|nr:Protein N-acetyltransferase, RimJ/RimL family [Bacillus sp. OV166]
MKIKLLDASDAERYWKLRLEALKQNPEAFLTSYEDAIKRENPIDQVAHNFTTEGNFTFGAFDDEELIGVVTLLQESAEKIRHRANIFAMYVTPKKQGLGVGKALMVEAINKAKTMEEIEKINLSVMASNERAKNLYTQLGFKVYGFEENALKVNGIHYNDEHMVLHLKSGKRDSSLKGENIYIRPFSTEDAQALLTLQTVNRSFFEQFSMERNDDFYTVESQLNRINIYEEDSKNDQTYTFGIFKNDGLLIGTINLFQVLRGSLQSAFIGYFLDEKHTGKGFTTEAAKLLVKYAFNKLKLHRIEAGVMPHNIGSIRVLEKSGFHKEGIALKNVKINGKWEDHQVLAIINPND